MKCSKCGTEITEGMKSCPKCGNITNDNKNNVSKKQCIIVGGIIIWLVLLVFGVRFMLNRNKNANDSYSNTQTIETEISKTGVLGCKSASECRYYFHPSSIKRNGNIVEVVVTVIPKSRGNIILSKAGDVKNAVSQKIFSILGKPVQPNVEHLDSKAEYANLVLWIDIMQDKYTYTQGVILLKDGSKRDMGFSAQNAQWIDIESNSPVEHIFSELQAYIEALDANTERENTVRNSRRSGYSNDELLRMAIDYYRTHDGGTNPSFEIASSEGNQVNIHIYEDMGDHNATVDWYYVDRRTGKGTNFNEEPIDLTQSSRGSSSSGNVSVQINGTRVNMRSAPSTSANVVYQFPGYETVSVLGKTDAEAGKYPWYKVSYNGHTGWVYGQFVR